ncbi:TRAP transporter large permease [Inmirania thermothiophila]|uniref:TRAP transporter large permease protein n=1 Tax=Inmirania thermothiophila TaxID=1750597 RepID=A0A3N1Y0T4_9GAMM|nr:TRAP transporter large permease [Inmirania thermothiophila]ROR32443.1 tripartite ATP-independent transporter DctM subunit [Inmirania thermothiophila]
MSWALLPAVLVGAPLFALVAVASMAGFAAEGVDPAALVVEVLRLGQTPVLAAVPMFTLAGYVLSEARTADRLVALSCATLGWMPGGLALVSLVACALFTAFTGASGVTIIALGALLYPALRKAGYGERFSLGLVTSAGSLGLLFAPSLPLILYGVVVQQMEGVSGVTIERLFLAGLVPGLLMVAAMSAWAIWVQRGRRGGCAPFSRQELARALWAARWELPIPPLVLGGIYGGWLAVSEVAVAVLLYVILVEVVILREVGPRRLLWAVRESAVLVGAVFVIVGTALAFTNLLVEWDLPARLTAAVQAHLASRWQFLLALNVFLLLLGAVLDVFSALVIVVPLLVPLARAYGVDPLHLGVIFLANMQIGYFTPPVGMNLFIASHRLGRPVLALYRAAVPFMLLLMAVVLVITFVPSLSLGLAGAG